MKPLEMDLQIRTRWTAALRSGEYEQGNDQLYDGGKYCCLGVLCDLAREIGLVSLDYDDERGEFYYAGEQNYLPEVVREWAGLLGKDPAVSVRFTGGLTPRAGETELSALNDEYSASFTQIADAIDGNQPEVAL